MKRRNKKTEKGVQREIRQTAVTLNRNYVNITPLRLEHMLPPLPDADEPDTSTMMTLGMPNMSAYCSWQLQEESGNLFLFFRTLWQRRWGIHLHRLLAAPPPLYSPLVFVLIHDGEMPNFYDKLGHDVQWERLLEI